MSDDSSTGLEGGDFVYLSLDFREEPPLSLETDQDWPDTASNALTQLHPFRETYALLLGRGENPELEETLYGASVGDVGTIEMTWMEDVETTDRPEATADRTPHIRAPARTVDEMLPGWLATIARQEGALSPQEFVDLPTTDIADEYMLDPDRLAEFQAELAAEIDGWVLVECEVVDCYRWSDRDPPTPDRSTDHSTAEGRSDTHPVDDDRTGIWMATAADRWPMAGGNRLLTGATATTIPTEYPTTEWQADVSRPVSLTPIVFDETVVVANGECISALDRETGTVQWARELNGTITAPPIYHDGTIYVGSESGEVAALNAGSAGNVWKRELDDPISHVTASGDMVLVRTTGGRLWAFEAADGHNIWVENESSHGAAILVWKGKLITRFGSRLTVVDPETGALRPLQSRGAGRRFSPTGSISDGRIVTGGADGVVCRTIDLSDPGAVRSSDTVWRAAVAGTVHATPTISDQLVTVTTDRSHVYGFDHSNGEKLWSRTMDDALRSRPVTDGSTVLVSSGSLFALDADDGSVRWSFPTRGPITAPPAVADGTVFVADEEGTVSAVR